jgi:hypothetical protein
MTPTFNTWDRAVLDKFALEVYLRMRKQEDQLEQLRLDLKDAIAAYRALNKEPSSLPINN